MGAYRDICLATTGIVLFWDLDDVTSTAADSQGSNTGTYHGTYTQGVIGESENGTTFDGTTGYVSTSTLPTSSTTSVTIEAWFNSSNPTRTTQCIVMNGSGSTGYGLFLSGNSTTNGSLYGLFQGVRWFQAGLNFKPGANEWHHAALVLNASGKPTIYLDGISIFTDTGTNSNTPVGGFMAAAQAVAGGAYFPGTIDGAALYTAALSAATILTHYKAGERAYKGAANHPARPSCPMSLDRGNPIAAGLVVAAPMGLAGFGIKNILNGQSPAFTGTSGNSTVTWASGWYSGGEATTTRGTSSRFQYTNPSLNQRSFTAEVWATITDHNSTSPYINAIWSNGDGSGDILAWYGNTINCDRIRIESTTGGTNFATLAPRFQLEKPHQYVFVGDPVSLKLYVDGILIGATPSAPANLAFTSATPFRGNTDALTQIPDGAIHQYHLWNRPLSASEIFTRWSDPWGLYDIISSSPIVSLVSTVISANPASLLPCI